MERSEMCRQSAQNGALILLTECLQGHHGEFITAEAGNDVGGAECLL